MLSKHGPAMLLVAAGGGVGAPARYVLGELWPPGPTGLPWSTFAVNVTGSLALGFLLELLTRSGPDTGRRRRVRLLFGTGFLGTFTTYSSLAVEADLLAAHGELGSAVAYAVGSVVVGLVAVAAGVVLAARLSPLVGDRR